MEAAQLVVDQGYTFKRLVMHWGVGQTTLENWVRKLRQEREVTTPKGTALTPDQRRIQKLERQLHRVETKKEILKKATALLMSDSLNNLR